MVPGTARWSLALSPADCGEASMYIYFPVKTKMHKIILIINVEGQLDPSNHINSGFLGTRYELTVK